MSSPLSLAARSSEGPSSKSGARRSRAAEAEEARRARRKKEESERRRRAEEEEEEDEVILSCFEAIEGFEKRKKLRVVIEIGACASIKMKTKGK